MVAPSGSGSGTSEWLRGAGCVGSVSAGGGCAVQVESGSAAVCEPGLVARVGPARRCSRVLGGLARRRLVLGGGDHPPSLDPPHRGAAAAAAGGTGRVTVHGGVGPGEPLWRGRGGWGDTVPSIGGSPLVVGGVRGWSARWLRSHTLLLLVHGGLWPGGVGWWAVVVVGVVLVVVVVGPLVVVALVVVGSVQRVWPLGPLVDIPVPLLGVGGLESFVVHGAVLFGGRRGRVGGRP